jgi:hypothetical protein
LGTPLGKWRSVSTFDEWHKTGATIIVAEADARTQRARDAKLR